MIAQDAVRHIATRNAGRIDECRVTTIDEAGLGISPRAQVGVEGGGNLLCHHGSHSIVGVLLPHIDIELFPQVLCMAHEFPFMMVVLLGV